MDCTEHISVNNAHPHRTLNVHNLLINKPEEVLEHPPHGLLLSSTKFSCIGPLKQWLTGKGLFRAKVRLKLLYRKTASVISSAENLKIIAITFRMPQSVIVE